MEFDRCPLCGSSHVELVFKSILECSDCGLKFTDISINPRSLSALYDVKYFKGNVYRDYIQEARVRTRLFKEKLRIIQKDLPASGRVLDVGCAAGFFLKVMRELGYKTHGVDISTYASNYARKILKLDVIEGELTDAFFPNDFFDIITMWDIIEHLPNPLETLAECNRIMKKGGFLVVETLNTNSLMARILRQTWPLFEPPYHLFYFNRKTLKLILEMSGFRIIRVLPIQTYIKTPSALIHRACGKGFRTFRYFRYPLLRIVFGKLFDDVTLTIAIKP